MILTDEELESKLSSPDNLLNQLNSNVEVQRIEKNHKGVGDKNVPPMVRSLIASVANSSDETQKEIGATFGISHTTVSKTARGLIDNRKDEALTKVIGGVKERLETAHDLALDNLVESLSVLGSKLDKIDKPEKLAAVAERMSNVVRSLTGNSKDDNVTSVRVILMAPVQKLEKNYEVIDA